MTSMRVSLACLSAATVLLSAGCGGGAPKAVQSGPTPSPYRGMTVVGSTSAPDFALRDQSGRLVRMANRQGRYTLVTFLYTNCPDVCPLIASHLNTALRGSARGPTTRVLAVSVDPKGDTPAAVRRFVAVHRLLPQFRYLTGTAAAAEARLGGLPRRRRPPARHDRDRALRVRPARRPAGARETCLRLVRQTW